MEVGMIVCAWFFSTFFILVCTTVFNTYVFFSLLLNKINLLGHTKKNCNTLSNMSEYVCKYQLFFRRETGGIYQQYWI